MGHECKKEKVTMKTYRDFFRRDSFEIKHEVLRVSKEECFYMKNTNNGWSIISGTNGKYKKFQKIKKSKSI
jgi:hypothetical protein